MKQQLLKFLNIRRDQCAWRIASCSFPWRNTWVYWSPYYVQIFVHLLFEKVIRQRRRWNV